MPRSSIAPLGPSLSRVAAEPVAHPAPAAPTPSTEPGGVARLARFTVLGLGIAGVLPPLAFRRMPPSSAWSALCRCRSR